MRLVSAHPGVKVSEIVESTGFELVLPQGDVPRSRQPSDAELELLRTRIDPRGFGKKELGL
ncbi:MAG: hypothetical protein R3B07_33495 [Polyangiaceae bacterium]